MFEFAYPWAFILLLFPILVHRFAPPYKESKDSVQVPFFRTLVEITGQTPQRGAVILQRLIFQKVVLVVAWTLIVTAIARPELVGKPIERTKSARDLLVAVDLSGSMATDDFVTTDGKSMMRLDAVKAVLKEFVARREHDRLGLIVFGDAPYLQSPFTEDHETWLTLLEETEIGMAGQSTKFGDAIGLAIKIFKKSDKEDRVLIVLTDGNDTASKVPPVDAAKVAASYDIKVYAIAIGDPETVGEEALDVETLKRVAEITGGGFFQALDRKELEGVYKAILKLEPEEYESLTFQPRTSLHHYLLGIVVLIYTIFWALMTLFALRRPKARHHA
jgi:Ca-activated chloride channel family protein